MYLKTRALLNKEAKIRGISLNKYIDLIVSVGKVSLFRLEEEADKLNIPRKALINGYILNKPPEE